VYVIGLACLLVLPFAYRADKSLEQTMSLA
jgi:hypothetical protein